MIHGRWQQRGKLCFAWEMPLGQLSHLVLNFQRSGRVTLIFMCFIDSVEVEEWDTWALRLGLIWPQWCQGAILTLGKNHWAAARPRRRQLGLWGCSLAEFGCRGEVFNPLEEAMQGNWNIETFTGRPVTIKKASSFPGREGKEMDHFFSVLIVLTEARLWFHLGKHRSTPEKWWDVGHLGKDCLKTFLLLAGLSGLCF